MNAADLEQRVAVLEAENGRLALRIAALEGRAS